LPVLIAALGLMLAGRVTAQTFTTLYSFTSRDPTYHTNSDGTTPVAGLILSGNTLYGTASSGGSSGGGTVFAVNTDGTGFTILHSFTAASGAPPYTNSDGVGPRGGLLASGHNLYGTSSGGGRWGAGTVFAVNTDGTGFTNLHSFAELQSGINSDGANPYACLVSLGNTLYGTAGGGGSSGRGTVFKVNTDGTGFTNLHNFTGGSDGSLPYAGLVLSNNTLYGTTIYGGSSGNGTVFAINTDGSGFTNLHSFTAKFCYPCTNTDGALPWANLILSGNTLYGTAAEGGGPGIGTVFKVNTDGSGFKVLYSFTAGSGLDLTNNDGRFPYGGLVLLGSTLYGTTSGGGDAGWGNVFAVNTDGTGFMTLYNFTALSNSTNSDGAAPWAGLILSDNTFYGTTIYGGSYSGGTVLSLSFRPQLTIIPSGPYVILTWPTNYAGFDYTGFTLQSATNLGSPVWTTNSPAPVVVNGQNTVTNPISGTQQFFRLSQ